MELLWRTNNALLKSSIADTIRPIPPEFLHAPSQNQHHDVCCHLVNITDDIDKAAVCCAGCHYEPIDIALPNYFGT